MPKIAPELSARAVSALKVEGRHAVGGAHGLHLRIANGHRGWVLRITVGDQRRDLGLGPFPEIGLAEAREKARDVHKLVRQGIDPMITKRAQRSALITRQASEKKFDWCTTEFIRTKSDEWKNVKHRQQWENTLKSYASPHIGHLLVQDIDLQHVLLCLEPIWRTKNETASRLRGRIQSVLDWATVCKYRSGDNPARWKGHLDKVLPAPTKIQKVQHHPAVAIDDMPSFILALRQRDGMAALALQFAILTAARSGEVRGAVWTEIDMEARAWTVPGPRMKAKREHRVPLSDAAIELLKKLPRIKDVNLVFPGANNQALSDMSLTAVMRRMEIMAVPHGFRSTFRDWAGDRTEYPRDLAELALAHILESKTEEAYRRGDALERRRDMMSAWAKFIGCTGSITRENREALDE
ncbi:tyrosine-type recombinase/integrase [Variovorax guangxiensis]|uniref:Site-specific integrase n=1 Tax=Variovorax guangxiensis TaxID=1775474 RepID=A0A502DNA3_9BURK|nr:site-specific integrase [Variovorax guangxiensis]TPG22211.1 site-specific integrase [Variovorax ginsengisoli]TPG26120.1 site-specific integrase [Variovorax guangxiensis]